MLQQHGYLSHNNVTQRSVFSSRVNSDTATAQDDGFRNAQQNTWFRKPLSKTNTSTITTPLVSLIRLKRIATNLSTGKAEQSTKQHSAVHQPQHGITSANLPGFPLTFLLAPTFQWQQEAAKKCCCYASEILLNYGGSELNPSPLCTGTVFSSFNLQRVCLTKWSTSQSWHYTYKYISFIFVFHFTML